MAIYRFRITFEDYEDVYREIDMPSKSTFLDLHREIQKTTGYDTERSSSFYVSNDQWKKGIEIAYLPNDRKKANGVLNVEEIRLSKFIDDPHQKFYYTYNFDRPYDFHVELIKILKEEDGKEYPALFKKIGEAPRNLTAANFPISPDDDDEDEFVAEEGEEYGVDEEDDYDMFDDEEGEESEGGESNNSKEEDY
ncbi:IS1096 element passenger TnpR family protein [Sphingobacterium daejeonense]|uniref:IS1096 element passenger TnpR family protein n=1 Tax=Sphingobacterium daejeonense TaxID=371142 RepID=UPI0010C596C6|nr:plasmid pRiA4b ORF-3 family protein [Sphingobacterium daejeonense]VTP89469.1 Plasmid pRiA4b ORF-3-like protein [Sphingobacterium daejeonense]